MKNTYPRLRRGFFVIFGLLKPFTNDYKWLYSGNKKLVVRLLKMATCRLCRQEKGLLKKSHIIPDFIYKDLYDDNHQLYSFNPLEQWKGQGYVKRPSSGDYEGGLLCADCDNNVIGQYESYAQKAMYGGLLRQDECPVCQNFQNQEGVKYTACKNISYKKFKLFLLSILWRASISNRPLFAGIKLGEHEEPIRQMIFNGDPGTASDYPIITMTHRTDSSMPKDVIGFPQQRKSKAGHTTFVFPIVGTIYVFYMNIPEIKFDDFVLSQTIQQTNEMNILHLPDGKAFDFFKNFHGIE